MCLDENARCIELVIHDPSSHKAVYVDVCDVRYKDAIKREVTHG